MISRLLLYELLRGYPREEPRSYPPAYDRRGPPPREPYPYDDRRGPRPNYR